MVSADWLWARTEEVSVSSLHCEGCLLHSFGVKLHAARQHAASQRAPPVDGVYIYGTEVLTLGLLWLGFNNTIREGDDNKAFVYWKFLLLIFKRGGCRNYPIKAINLLYQAHTLPTRLSAQLKWEDGQGVTYQQIYTWNTSIESLRLRDTERLSNKNLLHN